MIINKAGWLCSVEAFKCVSKDSAEKTKSDQMELIKINHRAIKCWSKAEENKANESTS